jgi:hypothetical protein
MKKLHRTISLIAALSSFVVAVQAQTVIGSWQGSGDDGWIDWGTSASILSSPTKYSLVSGAVSGYSQSLQLSQAGWNQGLAIKLEYTPGYNAAFLNNHLFSITWSIPAGTGGGYEQLWGLYVNASGYGFNLQPATAVSITGSGAKNGTGGELDFWSGSPAQTQTITWDYSSILPSITATPSSGYIELVLTSNGGGGAPNIFYFNNAVLSGGVVPEPSTLALMGFGALASLFIVRRKKA